MSLAEQVYSTDIFLIWTPEAQANFDDYGQSNITFDMTISAPAAGNGGVGGYTTTVNVGGTFNRVGLGVLEWDNNGVFDIASAMPNRASRKKCPSRRHSICLA